MSEEQPKTAQEALQKLRDAPPLEATWGFVVGRMQVILSGLIDTYHELRRGKGKNATLPKIVDQQSHEHVMKMLAALANVCARTYKREADMPRAMQRYVHMYVDFEAHTIIVDKLNGLLKEKNIKFPTESEVVIEDRSTSESIISEQSGDLNGSATDSVGTAAIQASETQQCQAPTPSDNNLDSSDSSPRQCTESIDRAETEQPAPTNRRSAPASAKKTAGARRSARIARAAKSET